MAAVRSIVLAMTVAACGQVDGFGGELVPLASIQIEMSGDFELVREPGTADEQLRVALVWGAQWLPELTCVLPPPSEEVAAVIAAGCRDNFGFVPDRVSESVAIAPNERAVLPVLALPSADVLVGNVTARIAYASLVVYDDRDATGRLELSRARALPGGDEGHGEGDDDEDDPPLQADLVYGASFVSMTEPDVRVVLREGSYNDRAAFYPRSGCGTPPPGLSIAAAGGFTADAAIAATLRGELPAQDPTTCSERATGEVVVSIPPRMPATVRELGCTGGRADGSVRYREPPLEPPDFTNRVTACAPVPDGASTLPGVTQLLISSRSDEPCKGLTHYVLRGCRTDAGCAVPAWDITATPPPWWPCPVQAAR